MSEQKKCKNCGQNFEVSEDDLEFIRKVSPEYGGQVLGLPSPELCVVCRRIEHLAWRNERSIYKTKSDKSDKEIVSIYAPNSGYKVYSQSEFYSDDWDANSFGKEFDFTKPFFQQMDDLMKKVPRLARSVFDAENSDFVNSNWHVKNCYLTFNVGYSEDSLYCTQVFYSKSCVDCLDVKKSERLYGSFDCDNCQNAIYLEHCKNTFESFFGYDCSDCKNVFMCKNLKHKQYYIRNKEYAKDEYFRQLEQFGVTKRSGVKLFVDEFEKLKEGAIHKENNNINAENCIGDYLVECKNCKNCFNVFKSEDCYQVTDVDNDGKDSRYVDYAAENEFCYDGVSLSGYKKYSRLLDSWRKKFSLL